MDLRDLATLEYILSETPVTLVKSPEQEVFLVYWKLYEFIDGKVPLGIITIRPEGDYYTNTCFITSENNQKDYKTSRLCSLLGCLKSVSLNRLSLENIKSLKRVVEIYCEKEGEGTTAVRIKEYSLTEKQEIEKKEIGYNILCLLQNRDAYTALEIMGELGSSTHTISPVLSELEEEGEVVGYFGEGSQRRYYTITDGGLKRLTYD